jgi:cell wall-associated NlpC family hydrolase
VLLAAALAVGCASGPVSPAVHERAGGRAAASRARAADPGVGLRAVKAALAVVGRPYRYGGNEPERGFDCSGLVTWSYARAGVSGLPHTAEGLERSTRPVTLTDIEPGDLLFFRLDGKKTAHVGLYVGDDRFVHAPSTGKGVEVVGFDHIYWSRHIRHAGRLSP